MRAGTSDGLESHRLLAWVLLGGFFFIVSVAQGIYGAHETEPSARFELLVRAGFMALLWFWFVEELRRHRPALPMDIGVFVCALWFVLVPYYFWRYEGGRGLLKAIGLFGVCGLLWALGALAAFVLA